MTEITIEEDLKEAIVEKVEQTEFDSVEEYVNFVLREILEKESPREDRDDDLDSNESLQGQLEDLGYL